MDRNFSSYHQNKHYDGDAEVEEVLNQDDSDTFTHRNKTITVSVFLGSILATLCYANYHGSFSNPPPITLNLMKSSSWNENTYIPVTSSKYSNNDEIFDAIVSRYDLSRYEQSVKETKKLSKHNSNSLLSVDEPTEYFVMMTVSSGDTCGKYGDFYASMVLGADKCLGGYSFTCEKTGIIISKFSSDECIGDVSGSYLIPRDSCKSGDNANTGFAAPISTSYYCLPTSMFSNVIKNIKSGIDMNRLYLSKDECDNNKDPMDASELFIAELLPSDYCLPLENDESIMFKSDLTAISYIDSKCESSTGSITLSSECKAVDDVPYYSKWTYTPM